MARHRLAFCLALLAGGLALSPGVPAQVSPGPLSRYHEELEGTFKCLQCHGTGQEAMEGKCLVCHDDIAWLRERQRGLHGRSAGSRCATCHPEHAGLEFELIAWDGGSAEKFDHGASGWPLRGKHSASKCSQCHQSRFQVSPAARLGKHADPARRWTGLDPACASCHDDIHRGALGDDCARCHGQDRWKPAIDFDHAATSFPLKGEHAKVDCAKCHQAERLGLSRDARNRPIPIYKPLPHAECGDCHKDPHARRLGEDCSRCHTPDSFLRVTRQAFDHDKTRYPLRGGHARVKCAGCHGADTARASRPKFSTCDTCHRDPHAGQATLAGKKVDCAACHEVKSWRSSTFTVTRHARTAYPLAGRHEKVACSSCHPKKGKPAVVLIRAAHGACTDCHADAHGGQLASRKDGGRCESCHEVGGWKTSLFDAEDHDELAFALTGSHRTAECRACHGPERPGLPPPPGVQQLGKARVALKLAGSRCADCHRDPHGDRFGERGRSDEGCLGCHDTKRFRPSLVDARTHQKFSFELEGAHRAVPCHACHDELAAPPSDSSLILAAKGRPRLDFPEKGSRCAGCHETPHGTQFAARAGGDDCQVCHGTDRFRPAVRFDHDRDSFFPLAGAHSRVACIECHRAERMEGKPVVRYRPVPVRCENCHANKPGTASTPPPVSPRGANP